MKKNIEINYKTLKQNYIEVHQFLKEKSGEENICNKSKIANDLSLWGDDNYYLLNDFINKYNLDFANFNYDNHFESEAQLFGPLNSFFTFIFTIINTLKFSLFIIVYLFSKRYSKMINDFKFYIHEDKIEKQDLTMGDLITSKICGKFEMRENVQFVISKI